MEDRIVVIGAQTPSGREAARKLRAEHYGCTLAWSDVTAQAVACMAPAGIVITGEEDEGTPLAASELLSLGIPVLALGACARRFLAQVGRASQIHVINEAVVPIRYGDSVLFAGVQSSERWVSRAEYYEIGEPYQPIAEGEGMPLAFADSEKKLYFLQFQIERNDPDGTSILQAFARDICGCTKWRTPERVLEDARARIAEATGDGEAICAMSGGLDSAVAALLAKQAVGERVRCVFVDTGLLRAGEGDAARGYFSREMGLDVQRVDVSAAVLAALSGVGDMQGKRDAIEAEIVRALAEVAGGCVNGHVYVKGTHYADIVSGCDEMDAPDVHTNIVEPLGDLFKDEIRMLGRMLGLSDEVLERQPFPSVGLAARIQGEVTPERLGILRRADALFVEAITEAGVVRRLSRYFALYMEQDGSKIIVLRALQGAEPEMSVARLPYDLLERTVARIQIEIPPVQRVLFDMTPGMAEWPT